MAGRISEEDIAELRSKARIEIVIGDHVQLRPAGGGSLKGLCPFHDEKTPSFNVTPARGLYHCFGCGEGGDVITFERKINNLSFIEAVQTLAERFGVELHIEDDGKPQTEPGLRARVLSANQEAANFYAAQITTPEAVVFRNFITGRGFTREAAEKFFMGYAPKSGKALRTHLNNLGFSDAVLVKAGLIRESGWDYFQGRVLWPIRDAANSVLGFGARRVFDEDRMPAKYLNTPETVVYHKSNVLYGLDLARRPIGNQGQAVIVEGYTDVMAAHLAGVETALASCGTAFGADHARLIQRLLGNTGAGHGEIIFTFDGDAAGQKAALKVFNLDHAFTCQTYVAIEPSGLDPCDLRIQHGDAAVRELIGRRIPLYEFVMKNIVSKYDLDRSDGRLNAVREAAPLITSVRDHELISSYVHDLARLVGMDVDKTRRIVFKVNRRSYSKPIPRRQPMRQPTSGNYPQPNPKDLGLATERGTLKLMLQSPLVFDTAWNGLTAEDFTHPAYRAIGETILRLGYQAETWPENVSAALDDDMLRQLMISLLVEPTLRQADESYAIAYVAKLQLLRVNRELSDLRSKLQRTNPVQHPDDHAELFNQYLKLQTDRRQLMAESTDADE